MQEHLVGQSKSINLFNVERGGIDSRAQSETGWKIVRVLKPFYTATLEICADVSCISLVIPLVSNLNNLLKTAAEDQGLKQMKAALRCNVSQIL